MPKIEIDPQQAPTEELLDFIAPKLETSLARRNAFHEDAVVDVVTGEEIYPARDLPVNKSIIMPSDYLPDEEARVRARMQHNEHLAHLRTIGVDGDKVRRISLMGNLLTETNLPQYVTRMARKLLSLTGGKVPESAEPLLDWQLYTWSPEEYEHIQALRDIGIITGELDLREYDRKAVIIQSTDMAIEAESLPELTGFLAPQEGATGPSHENTASNWWGVSREMQKDTGRNEMTHCKVNVDLLKWFIEIEPDHTIQAFYRQQRTFAMPGEQGIEGYDEFQTEMAIAGFFDFRILRGVQRAIVTQLGIADMDLTGRTAEYRDKLMLLISDDTPVNRRIDANIEKARELRIQEVAKEKPGFVPFILGRTVEPPTGNSKVRRIAA